MILILVVLFVVFNRDKFFYYLYFLFNCDDKVEVIIEYKFRRGIFKLYLLNLFLLVYIILLCVLKMFDIIIVIFLDKLLMLFVFCYFSLEIVFMYLLKDF